MSEVKPDIATFDPTQLLQATPKSLMSGQRIWIAFTDCA
jgi:hypothetical protein